MVMIMVMVLGRRNSGGAAGGQGDRMPIFNLYVSSCVRNVYAYIHILFTFYTRLSLRRDKTGRIVFRWHLTRSPFLYPNN